MKKIAICFYILSGLHLSAQYTAKDIFTTNSLVWCGLNFSQAKMIGSFDQTNGASLAASASEIKTKWMSAWNGLILAEPNNFKLKEAFKKSEIINDVQANEQQNQSTDENTLVSANAYEFSEPQKTVGKVAYYLAGNLSKEDGIGLSFIVESFNKNTNEVSVYVTLFDIKTRTLLFTEKMTGNARGSGFRNYWAGSLKEIINRIEAKSYKQWKTLVQ